MLKRVWETANGYPLEIQGYSVVVLGRHSHETFTITQTHTQEDFIQHGCSSIPDIADDTLDDCHP